ncbi:acyl-homoserine-lactone synthase [Novosphingobium sp. SG720]|uniref:acyl-homoserine-lactone synthase n=1 Tax=Novosphingobium sp. SG720 TaxID=2586998 RepID=UPI001447AF9F|nr:acyl-homoserine-lactone synthase [Novosphingobium sp. SG720]NKJ43468.1 acyl-homoserine lactone synthase [Novosphingobium sp. SG720]
MLHVVQFAAPPAQDAVLRSMFAARKSVFVDLLKWDVPVLDGRYEVDQFDDVHATYLVLAEPDGTHLASARLLPTTRPHILDSFFGDLCEDAPPRGADTFEITRFCLDRRLSARERREVRDTLVNALVHHALAVDIAAYSAVAGMGWFQQILAFGWRCMPLGRPRIIDGTMLAALRIEITPETPSLLEAGRSTAAALRVDPCIAA